MVKNLPNDPIFLPVVYFNGFYQIPKEKCKRSIFGKEIGPDTSHFQEKINFSFSREIILIAEFIFILQNLISQ